jgi:hypothetical protein
VNVKKLTNNEKIAIWLGWRYEESTFIGHGYDPAVWIAPDNWSYSDLPDFENDVKWNDIVLDALLKTGDVQITLSKRSIIILVTDDETGISSVLEYVSNDRKHAIFTAAVMYLERIG